MTNSDSAYGVHNKATRIYKIYYADDDSVISQNFSGNLTGTLQTAAQNNVTSLGTLTTLTVDNVITNGTTIGHTDDTDLITVADGVLTVAGEVDATTLDISGNADIDGTTNLDAVDIDGAVQVDATITVGADDQGYDVKFFGDTASAYMMWDTSADDLVLAGAAGIDLAGDIDVDGTANLDAVDIDGAVQIDNTVTVGVDDTGYDVKFFGDTASAYMLWDTSADDLILGGAAGLIVPDGQFTLGSTAVSATAAEINLIDGGTARGTTAVADADGILHNDGGTMRMTSAATFKTYFTSGVSSAADDLTAGDSAVNLTTSSGNITIDAAANDSDIIFKGTDNSSDITMLTLDGSDAGAATFNHDIILGNDSFVRFGDAGEKITGDGTDLTINSSNDLHLTATTDINVPANVGVTFGNDGEKIEGDGTDLTIAGNNINLTAVADVVIPANVGITFGSGEKIEGDSTDLTITSGAKINLTATSDVVIPANVGITFGSGEKIEGDSTDLTITSGADIALTATADVNLPNDVGLVFGDDGEKIEGDGTDLTILSSGVIKFAAGGTTNQITLADGALKPVTDNDVDLGTASLEFKNVYVDGTTYTDALGFGTVVMTLPTADGSANQILTTDGSGTLSFVDNSGGTDWQAIKTGNFTASAGQGVFANTTSSAFTVTLPSSPSLGDEVSIIDYAGTFDTNNLTVGRNSQPIMGEAADLTVAVERSAFTLVYVDSTQGWLLKDK